MKRNIGGDLVKRGGGDQGGEGAFQLQHHHAEQTQAEGDGDQILYGLEGLDDLGASQLLMPGDGVMGFGSRLSGGLGVHGGEFSERAGKTREAERGMRERC